MSDYAELQADIYRTGAWPSRLVNTPCSSCPHTWDHHRPDGCAGCDCPDYTKP